MTSIPTDPKKFLEALLGEARPDLPFPSDAIDRAQALARSEGEPPPAEVEALPEPLALALLEREVRQRRAGLADALAASSRKPLAKAAKKALYQLRSMGLAVPEKKAAPPAPPAAPAAPEELPAILSPPAGDGLRAVFIPRPMRGGGLEVWYALLSDSEGVVRLEPGESSRGAFRKQLKALHTASPPPALEIGRQEVRDIMSEAAGDNLRSKTPFPAGLEELLRYLGGTPREEPPSLPVPEPEDERLSTGAHLLHNEPEVQPWLPPEPQIRLLAQKMDEVRHSPLQLSEAQRVEQLGRVFRTAAEEFFSPELKRRYALRLWNMADFFERTERPEQARVARAEARRLFHGAAGLPSRFAEFLFEKVLELLARAQAGVPLPERGEPLAQEKPAEPAEKKSPGGLILP